MAKPRSRPQLSLEGAPVADDAAGIPPNHWSRLFFQHVFCRFDDAQFASLYQDRGRYPISPALLASVTILQYMQKASDRVAVDNTIMRRDWRIALGRDTQWTGFDPSVLCNFRKRLVAHGRQRELFEAVLDTLRDFGLLTQRRRLRVDATHLLSDVATLSRCDALREALRIVVCDLEQHAPELHERLDFLRLHEAYGAEVWLGGAHADEQTLSELGRDAQALLQLCGARQVRGKEVLAQMLTENFTFPPDEVPRPLAPDERPGDPIVTPHEPDARVGKHGDKLWIGDKVHVTETADEDRANFIVDVMSTDPRVDDSTVLEQLAQRLRLRLPGADQLLADSGYASATNTLRAAAAGIDLVAPARANTSRGRLAASEFNLDFRRRIATCPAGHESTYWRAHGRQLTIRFHAATCAGCPLRARCTTSPRGRTLGLSIDYEQLVKDRERAASAQFAALYARRAGIEATISHLARDCGLRRSRYRGRPKRELHGLLAATGLNVRRLLQWLASGEGLDEALSCAFWRRLGAVPRGVQWALAAILDRIVGPRRERGLALLAFA